MNTSNVTIYKNLIIWSYKKIKEWENISDIFYYWLYMTVKYMSK